MKKENPVFNEDDILIMTSLKARLSRIEGELRNMTISPPPVGIYRDSLFIALQEVKNVYSDLFGKKQ